MPRTYSFTVQDPTADSVEQIVLDREGNGITCTFHYALRDERGNAVKESNVGVQLTAQQATTIRNFVTSVGVPLIISQEGL